PDGTVQQESPAPVVKWTNSSLPAGALYDDAAGVLKWVTTPKDAGNYRVTFTATDDGDGTGKPTSDTTAIELVVIDANVPPVVAPIANKAVDAGATLQFQVSATDPDGTVPALSASGLPDFATFKDNGNGTATIIAQPGFNDRGDFAVTVRATDNGNG